MKDYFVIYLTWTAMLALVGFGVWTLYYAFTVCGWHTLWLGKHAFWAAIFGLC